MVCGEPRDDRQWFYVFVCPFRSTVAVLQTLLFNSKIKCKMETKKFVLLAMLFSLSLIGYPQGQTPSDTLQPKHSQLSEEAKQAGVYHAEPKQQNEAHEKPTTPKERRKAILTPKYYTNWLGASFFTIANLEKDLDIVPIQIVGLTFFYDFGDCFVGMRALENGVVVQMTLRLFADMATDFIQKAIDYGYKYIAKGKDTNIRSNTGEMLPDIYSSKIKQYRKATRNGNVYMEVSNSSRYANEYEITIYRTK